MSASFRRMRIFDFLILFGLGCTSCHRSYNPILPSASSLGSPRGYQIVRTSIHMHSPYSWDACDKNGLNNGTLNAVCLQNLRDALCANQIDFLFLTDHPSNMSNFEMRDLLLLDPKDQLILKNGEPYANRVGTCSQSFPTILVGFEGLMMSLGMTKHLDPDVSVREGLYRQDTLVVRNRLAAETEALVFWPHTENKPSDLLQSIQPDGIEIYNFHANIDPRIQQTALGLPPFQNLAGFLTFLIDPYQQLIPDFAFMNFLQIYPVYNQKWNTLIGSGLQTVGIGGTDSHQNAIAQTVSDGERLDSHRRIMRFMSNHFLVNSADPDSVKQAIQAGRGWVVFEGFGSPNQMDFYANIGGTVVGVGETGSLAGGSAVLTVPLPTLDSRSPQGGEKSIIRSQLKKVLANGTDEIVASAEGGEIDYPTQDLGAYRAEISIIPRHLRSFLADFSAQADLEYTWIITNHIYLVP